jgi:hypothetical protein
MNRRNFASEQSLIFKKAALPDKRSAVIDRRYNTTQSVKRVAKEREGERPREPKLYFINSTERLRLISRVILRCMCAGMPVIRRGRIFPLSVTNFFSKSGFL